MTKAKESRRRAIKRGEALAIDDSAIRKDERGAFFFMFGPGIKANERVGDLDEIAVVNVRGPLDQFDDCYGDNYEAIVDRVRMAMSGDDVESGYAEDEDGSDPPSPEPPRAVILRISSPGGVVAGLWECVAKLQRMSADSGVPLVAYANDMAASAAYALACACESIYVPRAGNLGSIGVISHMFSIARANDEAGIDVKVIASGDEKTDGNENLPISDEAEERERARVDRLARQFFEIVASARGLDVEKVESYQAGLFLGKQAEKRGLADRVMGWDEAVAEISLAYGSDDVQPLTGQSLTDQRSSQRLGARATMTALKALIAQTKKKLAKATGKARAALSAKLDRLTASLTDLEAYKKTTYEKETSEEDEAPEESEDEKSDDEAEGDDEDKKDEDSESDDDEKKSKKSKKADDDADAEDADDDADAEDDDEKEDAEDDSADDEAMLSALTSHLKGRKAQAARGFLAGLVSKSKEFDKIQPTVAQLKLHEQSRKKNALIDEKLKARFINKAMATKLRAEPLATVKATLKLFTTKLYFTEEDALVEGKSPDALTHGGRIPEYVQGVIESAARTASNDPKEQEKYRADAVKRWHDLQTNGAGR